MAFNRIIKLIFTTPDNEIITIEDLKIQYETTKNNTNDLNQAIIKIWNLSKSTEKLIKKIDTKIEIRVGYVDENKEFSIFFGEINTVNSSRNELNYIISVLAYESSKTMRESTISVGYDKNTSNKQIIKRFASKLNLPLSNINNIIEKKMVNGYSFIGRCKDGLQEILDFTQQKYTVDNNEIIIYKSNEEVTSNIRYILSKDTGMIESPQLITDIQDKNKDDGKQRISVKALIITSFPISSEIEIISEEFIGIYSIESAYFKGDNWNEDNIVELGLVQL